MDVRIDEFFENANVLITGGTGFIGKVLIEKLLRSQNNINKFYILIRPKKGKNIEDRLKKDIYDQAPFQELKKINPNYMDKIVIMQGDILEPRLGLNDKNLEIILDEVNIVYNCAASVNLAANMRHSVKYNLKSVLELLEICRRMKNLKSLVLISTAYSNCNRKLVEEKIYEAPVSADLIMSMCKELEDDVLEKVTKIISNGLPCAYVISKSIMENSLCYYSDLPIVLFRPGIVTASYLEPLPGWIDNFNGAMGAYYATAMGLLRVTPFDGSKTSNWTPVDYCTNALICSAWHGVQNRSTNNNKKLAVYNYTCDTFKRSLNEFCRSLNNKNIRLQRGVWKQMIFNPSNGCRYYVLLFILQYLPTFLLDALSYITGSKMRFNKTYKEKIVPYLMSLTYFASNEWTFEETNTFKMWDSLSEEERKRYSFDPRTIDYDRYMTSFWTGIKVYLGKEDMEKNDKALRKHKMLNVIHYLFMSMVIVTVVWILYSLLGHIIEF